MEAVLVAVLVSKEIEAAEIESNAEIQYERPILKEQLDSHRKEKSSSLNCELTWKCEGTGCFGKECQRKSCSRDLHG